MYFYFLFRGIQVLSLGCIGSNRSQKDYIEDRYDESADSDEILMSYTCLSSTGYYFLFAKLYRECQKLLLFPDLLIYMITVLKWAFTD